MGVEQKGLCWVGVGVRVGLEGSRSCCRNVAERGHFVGFLYTRHQAKCSPVLVPLL